MFIIHNNKRFYEIIEDLSTLIQSNLSETNLIDASCQIYMFEFHFTDYFAEQCLIFSLTISLLYIYIYRARSSIVEALSYKPKGCGFDF